MRSSAALVIVHLSSLDSLAWHQRPAAEALSRNLQAAVTQYPGPVVIIDQKWRPVSALRLPIYFAGGQRSEVTYLKHDESRDDPWELLLARLIRRLHRAHVHTVDLGGLWYDPQDREGCVNHVQHALTDAGFAVRLLPELLGEVEYEENPRNNRDKSIYPRELAPAPWEPLTQTDWEGFRWLYGLTDWDRLPGPLNFVEVERGIRALYEALVHLSLPQALARVSDPRYEACVISALALRTRVEDPNNLKAQIVLVGETGADAPERVAGWKLFASRLVPRTFASTREAQQAHRQGQDLVYLWEVATRTPQRFWVLPNLAQPEGTEVIAVSPYPPDVPLFLDADMAAQPNPEPDATGRTSAREELVQEAARQFWQLKLQHALDYLVDPSQGARWPVPRAVQARILAELGTNVPLEAEAETEAGLALWSNEYWRWPTLFDPAYLASHFPDQETAKLAREAVRQAAQRYEPKLLMGRWVPLTDTDLPYILKFTRRSELSRQELEQINAGARAFWLTLKRYGTRDSLSGGTSAGMRAWAIDQALRAAYAAWHAPHNPAAQFVVIGYPRRDYPGDTRIHEWTSEFGRLALRTFADERSARAALVQGDDTAYLWELSARTPRWAMVLSKSQPPEEVLFMSCFPPRGSRRKP